MRLPVCFAAILGVVFIVAGATAGHADKLTEANMTKKDFDEITKTESSVPGEKAVGKPQTIHDLSHAGEKAVKDAHGVKVIKGRDWKKATPVERDKQIRELRKTMPEGSGLWIEVPGGDVWIIDAKTYLKLVQDKDVTPWTAEEEEKLPKAVKRDPLEKPEDRRNDGPLGSLRTDFRF